MPVDVQVGPFLWEDAPQELRSRLWIALLGNPRLIGNLVEEKVWTQLNACCMRCTLPHCLAALIPTMTSLLLFAP